MPIDPGYGERLARRVSQLIADAEYGLVHTIAAALARDLDSPTWARDKLAALEALRVELARQLGGLPLALTEAVEAVVAEALMIGQTTALADITAAGIAAATAPGAPVAPALARAVTLLAADTTATVTAVPSRLLRAADDIYRRVVADASATVLLGAQTRRQAAQQALNRLTERGVGGITDRRGRRWAPESYVEMAVRTATGRAAVEGHVRTLSAAGLDLVVVSDAARECPDCRPWEGKILSISGQHRGRVEVASTTEHGATVMVTVAGTVADARAAGLQHPNCRHNLSAYLPGATRVPEPSRIPGGYDASQRQRAIERHIRSWKLREAGALDDTVREQARAKVRHWQAEQRAHLAENPGMRRKPEREQIGKAR